ncbi:ferrochelatase [Gammaproteobacteria bacterium 45_16_T64]|nr:ferrochelatase [Gammaproteobacteria bacterium 45_16_T64]
MPSETPPFGVLLINLGTPDEPTPRAIRRYLKQFLWDPRVIDTPRVLWWLILHLIILPIRPKVIAKNYQSIWTDKGSPLLVYSNKQKEALRTLLTSQRNQAIPVEIAMTYGSPSIKHATDKLLSSGISHLVVLPLYPQFSATTTGAALDALSEALRTTTNIPEISFIRHYYKEDGYIKALANSIRTYWEKHGKPDKLLFSFHGIPEHYETNGDPYPNECRDTAHLTAEALGLEESEWMLSFQSRVGRAEWVKPYTDKTLESLGEQATGRVDVICPAFSVDCLETLEEIDQENRHIYMGAGGQEYHYIPCLNADQEHIEFFSKIIQKRV